MLVEVRDLKLSIGPVPILQGVQLGMDAGDIYGLLGPNGAGKSTTLSVLTGLRRAGSGSVSVLGLDPATQAQALRRRIGVLSEDSGLYGWMKARDYLRFMSSLYGLDLAMQQIEAQLERVGLPGASAHPVGAFSRGMKQRLGLARALLHKPELLVLDEPTNGLDPRGRREIHDLLIDLSQHHGVGILLCTHLLDDVDRLCNRIGIIADGRSVVEGSLADLLATRTGAGRYRLRLRGDHPLSAALPEGVALIASEGEWMHVALPAKADPGQVWAALLAAGWDLVEIHNESGGLEDFYLDLTHKELTS